MKVKYIPKLLRIPALIGLASAGVMVAGTMAAAARTAADTKPPVPPYICSVNHLRCTVQIRIMLSTDDQTPQNQIRYQVFSNGVPISGDLLLADTRITPPGWGYVSAPVAPAPTARRWTLEAVDQAGNHSQMSPGLSRTVPGPC
jgi:hypothetical protein